MSPLDTARAYLRAIETRAPLATLRELLHEDVVIEVLPNRLDPRGTRRTLDEALAGAEKGRALLREERYEITSAVEAGAHVVLEFTWTGVLAVPMGALPAGGTLRCRTSSHLEVRGGRIVAQRNYDCFDPF